jgi:ABC-type nitrate/sulfonate/bicarbonate transport system permease component
VTATTATQLRAALGPATLPTPPTSRRSTRVESLLLRLIVPAALIAVWEWASRLETKGLFIAGPFEVVRRVRTDYLSASPSSFFLGQATFDHVIPSLSRALMGFALAAVLGVTIGVVLGLWPVMAALFTPIVHLGRSLPTPALLGVVFFLFGTGDLPKVLLIAFGAIWPVLFNTMDGTQSLGTERGRVAQVFRIPFHAVLTRIVLPGAAPKIFVGLRTALSLSLILMIISELQKSLNGLGYTLNATQRNFDYEGLWAVLVVLAILGVALNFALVRVERRVLAWHRGATGQHD